MTGAPRRAAIVLAGGRATRLGGADKASVDLGGTTLIEGVLAAVRACEPVVVVGPAHLGSAGVRIVREDPPFGGPVAAVAAAVAVLPTEIDESWVLACDLPRASEAVELLSAAPIPAGSDAVVLRDAAGFRQPLAGRYRVAALRRAIDALPRTDGVAMRRLTDALRVHEVQDVQGASIDLDTWHDVAAYRATIAAPARKERP